MTTRRRFVSVRSAELMAKMLAFLAERGGGTAADIAAELGLETGYVSSLLKHMARHSRIHCVEPQMRTQRGSTPAMWAAGKLPVPDDDNTDHAPQRVIISSTWPRGQFQRDPMIAAFFGAAQQ